jgi:hypothetical protein
MIALLTADSETDATNVSSPNFAAKAVNRIDSSPGIKRGAKNLLTSLAHYLVP